MLKRHLVLPCLPILLACGHSASRDHAGERASIEVASPNRIQEFERISVSGSLTPQGASSLVAFQVSGRAVQVLAREGDAVRKGQVLAVLDAVNLTHALEAAQAQVKVARAASDQAEQEFGRMKQLFDSRSLAPNDFAKFTAARDATREQVRQAVASEGIARKNLAEATLTAPIAGFVARRMVEPGVMVGAGQSVFELAQLDPIEVNVGIPETDVRLVKAGQAAMVTIPAWPGKAYQGRVKLVNVSADPATRTYMARITVPNPSRELKVGMVAEVSITGSQRLDILTVPADAIVRDPQGATLVFQYFPDQRRVFSKRVDVGGLYGREIQIRSGLQGGERVVVAGQHMLRNGMEADAVQGRN